MSLVVGLPTYARNADKSCSHQYDGAKSRFGSRAHAPPLEIIILARLTAVFRSGWEGVLLSKEYLGTKVKISSGAASIVIGG